MFPLDPLSLGDACLSLGTDLVRSKGRWGWRSIGIGLQERNPVLVFSSPRVTARRL